MRLVKFHCQIFVKSFSRNFSWKSFFSDSDLVLAGHKNITISREIYMCELCSTRALRRTLCVVRHIIHLQFSFYFKTRENAMHISSEGGTRGGLESQSSHKFLVLYLYIWLKIYHSKIFYKISPPLKKIHSSRNMITMN